MKYWISVKTRRGLWRRVEDLEYYDIRIAKMNLNAWKETHPDSEFVIKFKDKEGGFGICDEEN